MYNNFKRMIGKRECTDEQIETFFWLVVKDLPEVMEEAMSLLKKNRPEVAKKVARTILEAAI